MYEKNTSLILQLKFKYLQAELLKNIELFIFDKNISPNSTAIIERFNRTLRAKIDKYMSAYKTNNYISVLDKLVKNYNNSVS